MPEEIKPDDLFLDDSTKPESSWYKFEKIGDGVQGTLIMEPYESEGKFGPQTVYVIQKADGTEVDVSLKNNTQKFLVQQLKSAVVGDILAFRYTGDIDTGKINPAKKIEVRIKHVMSDEKKVKEAGL